MIQEILPPIKYRETLSTANKERSARQVEKPGLFLMYHAIGVDVDGEMISIYTNVKSSSVVAFK